MTVLEQVIQMKGRGMPEAQIITELSQQGVSPREINDALKQAQIKYAVSNSDEEMQPSILQEEVPQPNQESYAPQAEQQYQQSQGFAQQGQYIPQEQQYYPSQEGGYQQSPEVDTDMIMEVADQIFSDRIRKIQKQLDSTTEIATLSQTKVENISDRLKKIEAMIDKLQIAILDKVGSYGKNLEEVKKEMSMMQDSFSKMIVPSRRQTEESSEEVKRKTPKKR